MSKIPAGYKQTEIGVIPEDWLLRPLAEVVTFLDGKRRPVKDADRAKMQGSIPYYGASGIVDYVNDYLFDDELILLGEDGENIISRNCRLAFRISGKTWVNNHAHVLKPDSNTSIGFLTDYLESLNYERFNSGTAQPKLNKQTCSNILVAIPPTKAEQEAIAEALSDTDALIESLGQLIAKKRHLKQGAMQELLTGKKRLPGFSGEWEVRRLDAVCSMKSGEGITAADIDEGSTFPCFGGNGLRGYAKRYTHDGNYALIGRQGALCGNVLGVTGKFFASEHAIVVTPFPQTDIVWLTFVLDDMDLNQYSESSAQPGLSVIKLSCLTVACPSTKAEQTAIAAILSDMDAEIAALETKLAKTRQLKQGMMHNLLTGKIRLVSPTANITVVPEKKDSVRTATSSHNWQINETVIIAVLAKHFGSEQYPLARKRCTKLTYLLHRHIERKAEGYLKKAAGPYNPATRYKGPEGIAQKNGYVRAHHNGTYQGFVAAANIAQAEDYFQQWYGQEALAWLEQFRLKKTDELELLTTVDMAMEDLHREGKAIQVGTVKQVIHDHPEWIAKLRRELFSDINIARAMQTCRKLFA